jgi:transcriptional antiterminator NusG
MSDSELNPENANIPPEPLEPVPVENSHFKWYILQAHTGYEKRVQQTIEKQLEIKGLQHLVGEIFIPSEEVIRSKGGKQRVVTQKYFPGYLLLHMDLQEDLWHLIIKTNRVTGFVGRKHHEENRYIPPIPLSNEELMAIKEQIDSGFQQASVEEEFVREQKVMITEGPFSNFSGVIDEISHERGKLKVLVSIFGRPTPVEVDFDKVVKA